MINGTQEQYIFKEVFVLDKKMVNLILQDNSIIIKLTNEDNKSVFMRSTYNPCEENSQLVFIEVETLKKYWARNIYEEYSKYANASEQALRQDYKFHYAEEGFSRGEEDPVPVAEISLLNHTELPSIGFRNGITRTTWLMANGYKIIPFKVASATRDFLLEKGVYTLPYKS